MWASGAGCLGNYLFVGVMVGAFRADPEVQAALRAARAPELAEPTLAAGETWRDVREVRIDVAALAERGMGYEHLDQLALEHLYGVR